MIRIRSALVVLAALIAAALMLAAPASQAAVQRAAVQPAAGANLALQVPGTDAKKAQLSLARKDSCWMTPNSVCRQIGNLWTNANYGGTMTRVVVANYGDCNESGYVINFPNLSNSRQTSSISRVSASPRCNTVGMTTTYGGTAVRCLSLPYVGAAFNDVILKIRIYYTPGC